MLVLPPALNGLSSDGENRCMGTVAGAFVSRQAAVRSTNCVDDAHSPGGLRKLKKRTIQQGWGKY